MDNYDEAMGKTIYEVAGRDANQTFAQWVDRVSGSLETGFDVVYQMPFIHEGMRGIADFLVRVEESPGYARYEPVNTQVDAQQGEARARYPIIAYYSEAIAALTGRPPRRMHIWLGSGTTETLLRGQGVLALLATTTPPARGDSR